MAEVLGVAVRYKSQVAHQAVLASAVLTVGDGGLNEPLLQVARDLVLCALGAATVAASTGLEAAIIERVTGGDGFSSVSYLPRCSPLTRTT